MNHIRFLSTNDTVCESPRHLGYDFVVVDYAEGKSCNLCLSLILAHNARERQYDLLVDLPKLDANSLTANNLPSYANSWSKGWWLGIAFSSSMWVLVFCLWMLIFA